MDETNHTFYKTWKDRGGNIGIQCTFKHADVRDVTFWTGNETIGKIRQDENDPRSILIDCFNCQAIVKANVLTIENENHRNEQEGGTCAHQPSQV